MTTVTSPSDLLAAVPFLIGYQPSDSIVLMSLTDESITMAMRIDFPQTLTSDDAASIARRISTDNPSAILMVSYIPDDHPEAEEVIRVLTQVFQDNELPIKESIIVLAGRWRSLVCLDQNCCPIEGSPLEELSISRVAAEEISNGKLLPFIDLESMASSIAAAPEDLVLAEMISRVTPIDYLDDPLPEQRKGAECVVDFLNDFANDGICNDKRLLANLLVRLQDLQVRDFALGSMKDDEAALNFAAWRWLLRQAPKGFVAAPATIFAVACYEQGDGALANLALERAREDQPGYPMAKLLGQVFGSGQPPTLFRDLRAELHPQVCAALFSGSMKE